MTKYVARPVEVEAYVITDTFSADDGVNLNLVLDDGRIVRTEAGMLARYRPHAGDYYVEKQGYASVEAKEEFENDFTKLAAVVAHAQTPASAVATEEQPPAATTEEGKNESV